MKNHISDRHLEMPDQKDTMPTMKRIPIRWTRTAIVALLALITSVAHSDNIPALINYQGRLTDTLGNPVASGYYEIAFRIWDDATLNGVGDLVWARTFPVHVVTNGLFNVLLSDAGGMVTNSAATTALLDAFNGPDRYLGLTITISNGVSMSGTEISPRQQLASAPYAVHAQIASTNVANSVGSDSLLNGSVVAGKIGVGAVTTTNIADGAVTSGSLTNGAVTTAKIADGAVTSAKLNINGDYHLNDHTIYLRGGSDTNHGLKYTDSFGGQSMDGPVLFGYGAGALGTTSGGQKAALTWKSDQSVTANGALTANGPLTATNGAVSIFGAVQNETVLLKNMPHTAATDGFLTLNGYNRTVSWTVWPKGVGTNGTAIIYHQGNYQNAPSYPSYYTVTLVIGKGETWQVLDLNNGGSSGGTYFHIYWRPIGKFEN